MLNVNDHKNFTATGDMEAEMLLKRVLSEIGETLSGTGLCVVLGGSYGRGDGGVRLDRENGILYNDLDFFVFARKKCDNAEKLLDEVAEKYEKELKVDVDFSRIMSVKDIKNNARRLMMQELKRGYRLAAGEDLLEKYLPEFAPEALPFSEACRLLLNRGMGLLLAGAKISSGSTDTDFILRNIYKAILGAGDAMLIAGGKYSWKLAGRREMIVNSDLPDMWKTLYCEAVDFKSSPHRQPKENMSLFWHNVRDFFRAAVMRCAEDENIRNGIYKKCTKCGEISLNNYIKYCIKSRTLQLKDWKRYTVPAAAVLAEDVFAALDSMPEKTDEKSGLYRQWLIFN